MPEKKPKLDSPAGTKRPSPTVDDTKEVIEFLAVVPLTFFRQEKLDFKYDPVHFIRSHSKNNDPADVQTQIWEVRPA